MQTSTSLALSEFEHDVLNGLQKNPKSLSSKYFYDDEGSRLFQQIMHLPEYYLTRSELEIFTKHKEAMLSFFNSEQEGFELIELGAGDGLKTKVLLSHFSERNVPFTYIPIDISEKALDELIANLSREIPDLAMQPVNDDYFKALNGQMTYSQYTKRIVFFLGSNIGNFSEERSTQFLNQLKSCLNPGDMIMIGFDLQKNPFTILSAYNDTQGITRDFNMNLLDRINRELGADFRTDRFVHYPIYDPAAGEARSYLVSLLKQQVYLEKLDEWVYFEEGEAIHTETSRKYTLSQMKQLCTQVGLKPIHYFTDSKHYFADMLLKV